MPTPGLAIPYQGLYPFYAYPLYPPSAASYINLYPTLNPLQNGGYNGAVLGVPNSGSLYTVSLTNDQLWQIATAVRFHLATGLVNRTIAGVQVITASPTSVNIVVAAIGFTITLGNGDATNFANAATLYVSTGSLPPVNYGGSPLL